MSQTLMVRFGADTSAAKKAIVDLASSVATNAVTMATAVRGNVQTIESLAGAMAQLPTLARAAIGGFIAFQAATLTIGAATAAMEAAEKQLSALVALGARAQASGVGTTFLQSWTAQAKALNVEASTLEGMLKRARDASTVRQGEGGAGPSSAMAGRLEDQAKAGNLTASDVKAFADQDTQEQRIRIVLDLISRLMTEGKQLAALDLAGKMFGSDFEEKLRSGVDMVGRMKEALAGLTVGPDGRIVPPEEVENAKRITATMDEAQRIMTDALRPLNEDIARLGQQQAQSWADTKVSIAQVVSYLMQIYNYASRISETFAEFGNSDFFKKAAEYARSIGFIDTATRIPGVDTGFEKPAAAAPAEGSPLSLKIAPKADRSNSLLAKAAPRSKDDAAEKNPVDSFIDGIRKSAAALKAETDAFNGSNKEKRIAIDLAKAQEIASQNGIRLTEAQTARLRDASAATADYRDKLANLEQQQRQNADAARYFGSALSDSLGDAILDGVKLSDILGNLSKQLGRQSLNALVNGTGPLAGMFGTSAKASEGDNALGGLMGIAKESFSEFFGGFKANGGPVLAGQAYRINEVGEEWFVPDRDGRILSARDGAEAARIPGALRLGRPPALREALSSAFGGFRASGGSVAAGRAYRINELGREWFAPQAGGSGPSRAGAPGGPGPAAGGPDRGGPPVVVHFNVTSPDAASFARSEAQVTGALMRAVQRGMRGS